MKRIALILATAASLAATAPTLTAYARDGDDGRRAERVERRGEAERGRGRGGDEAGPRRRGPPAERELDLRRGRAPVLGYGDGPRRRDDDRPRYEEGRRAREAPPPRARGFASPPPAARRGGYLPPTFSGEIVDDYRRYRLRAPPAGFAWVRVGGGFALVSMADGQIFDMVQ